MNIESSFFSCTSQAAGRMCGQDQAPGNGDGGNAGGGTGGAGVGPTASRKRSH